MRVYYAAEGAFYAASVGMLLLWEERRRDFAVMMLHHLTTCGLIAASYSMRCALNPPPACGSLRYTNRVGACMGGWTCLVLQPHVAETGAASLGCLPSDTL